MGWIAASWDRWWWRSRVPAVARSGDGGYSLLEMLVSMALVNIVMAGVVMFLAQSMSLTRRNGNQQAAVQLAADAMELIHAVSGATLNASVPSSPETKTVNGVAYRRSWSVATCWQPAAGGTCVVQSAAPGTGYLPFFQLSVTVSWTEPGCRNTLCSFSTTALVNAMTNHPLFNTKS